ncbi:MAG: DUF368 domain-containing protein [Clostridiales bacterium]|nr:DUF368 domain-containing protein [Clostridiales bacterium]
MSQVDLQMELIKYNKKTWCKSGLLGFIIGLAVIIPGISGSTVAIIFKLYDQFLYAIGNLFKKFKKCVIFLLPIGLGAVLGFGVGFLGVQKLLEINTFAVVCLFAGLMCGAFPAVKDEIKGAKITPKRVALFAIGLCIPVALGCVSAVLKAKDLSAMEMTLVQTERFAGNIFLNFNVWHVFLAIAIGFVVGITQIVPGLSASAFLMSVGWYKSLTESVSMTFWKGNPLVFLVYGGLAVGFLLGMFAFSKLLTFVFGKARHTAYYMIVGMSLGSLLSMFCNGDIMTVYYEWAHGGVGATKIALSIGIGTALFVVGVVIAYLLVRYERKKTVENTAKAEQSESIRQAEIAEDSSEK